MRALPHIYLHNTNHKDDAISPANVKKMLVIGANIINASHVDGAAGNDDRQRRGRGLAKTKDGRKAGRKDRKKQGRKERKEDLMCKHISDHITGHH